MNFTALPSEIKLEVSSLLSPYDIENLALSCKELYSIAPTALPERHNALRKKYRTVNFGNRGSDASKGSRIPATVPELLCDIAACPIIAQYIVHLQLDGREPLYEPGDLDDDDDEDDSEEDEDAGDDNEEDDDEDNIALTRQRSVTARSGDLRKLITASCYLAHLDSSPKHAKQWFRGIVRECPGFSDYVVDLPVAFLLTLLPNLESLGLSRDWTASNVETELYEGSDVPADDLARRIPELTGLVIERANNELLQGQPLAKLRVLQPKHDVDDQFGEDILKVAPFLALKSLRKAHYYHGTCTVGAGWEPQSNRRGDGNKEDGDREYDESDIESRHESYLSDVKQHSICARYPVLGPNIEVMQLDSCTMDAPACAIFFQDMKKLKTLIFEYSTKDGLYDWNIDTFIQDLAMTVGGNLEKLVLSIGDMYNYGSPIRSHLREFGALRHLELNTVFFKFTEWNNGEYVRRPEGEQEVAIRPLVDILPVSLESLTLLVPCGYLQSVQELFAGFQEKRQQLLPSLTTVVLRVVPMELWKLGSPEAGSSTAAIQAFGKANGLEVVVETAPTCH